MLGFSSATQDIVIDAYRIESAEPELQAMMSSTYIVGYRLAMLMAGAGSLYLAQGFGSSSEAYNYQAWQYTYSLMAVMMIVGVVTTLVISEPQRGAAKVYLESTREYIRFVFVFAVTVSGFIAFYLFSGGIAAQLKTQLASVFGNANLSASLVEGLRLTGALAAAWLLSFVLIKLKVVHYEMVERTYLMPVRDFFDRYGGSFAWTLLALIGLYRISDIVLGVISNVFYKDLGFSKSEIADVVIVFGIFMTILGGLLGGLLAARIGVIRIMLLGGVLAAATNLLFMLLAQIGNDMFWLYLVISADNLSAGIASAAFVAFLSSLTNVSFTAMQYAIFSSLMTLVPKSLGGYSGSMVDAMGYSSFFLLTAVLGLPVLLLILVVGKRFEIRDQSA
jgi:PAT family beta-lactamase induction signal transducer AmpG